MRPGEVMHRERRRVYYSGRVQGVGFRFTCQHVARGFDVAGYVRNLPDGRVELVAEGDPAEIDAFLKAIQDAMGRYIRDVDGGILPALDDPADRVLDPTLRPATSRHGQVRPSRPTASGHA